MPLSLVLALTVVLALPLSYMVAIERIHVKLGEPAILKCNISLLYEIFWLRMSMTERPRLLMVTRIKNDGGLTEVINYNSLHFESCLVDKFFGLKILGVSNNDLGSYYCGKIEGKRMEFDEGVHIYADEIEYNPKEVFSTPPPVAEERQFSYPIFAVALAVGLLVMVLVVFIVHMMTCRKSN